MKLPKLRPIPPSKPVRLTLTPHEVITLFAIVSTAADSLDAAAETSKTAAAREVADFVWELEGKLSDKLTFEPV